VNCAQGTGELGAAENDFQIFPKNYFRALSTAGNKNHDKKSQMSGCIM
jgi:hypothetical protein